MLVLETQREEFDTDDVQSSPVTQIQPSPLYPIAIGPVRPPPRKAPIRLPTPLPKPPSPKPNEPLPPVPRKAPTDDTKKAREAIKEINRQVQRATEGARKTKDIPFPQQRRIARTVARKQRRRQAPRSRPVHRCEPCTKVFSCPRLLAEHKTTKKHINKLWATNRPECLVCPYIPTSAEDWERHITGRRHRK